MHSGEQYEAHLFVTLPSSIGSQEHQTRRTEGVFRGENDPAVVDSLFEFSTTGTAQCKVPFEDVVLGDGIGEEVSVVVGAGIS